LRRGIVIAHAETVTSPAVHVRRVGSFAVLVGQVDRTPRGRKARAIIAYLAANAGQTVPRDRLIEMLWGGRGEAQARASLRQALREIRSTIDSGIVQSDRDHLWIESTRLQSPSVEQTQAETCEDFYADLNHITPQFDEWLMVERSDCAAQHWTSLKGEVERLLESQRGDEAMPLIERMERIDPHNEDWLRLGMLAEYQAAHPAGIQKLYREMVDRLDRELGVSPAAQTKALHDELLEMLTVPVRQRTEA
jgi:DNA-binding SARP family transcriptional activator